MNQNKQMKVQKAVDKMMGVDKLYIVLHSKIGLTPGDKVCVTGVVGENGEVLAGSINVSREFGIMPHQVDIFPDPYPQMVGTIGGVRENPDKDNGI